jgi:hypothetical protein
MQLTVPVSCSGIITYPRNVHITYNVIRHSEFEATINPSWVALQADSWRGVGRVGGNI